MEQKEAEVKDEEEIDDEVEADEEAEKEDEGETGANKDEDCHSGQEDDEDGDEWDEGNRTRKRSQKESVTGMTKRTRERRAMSYAILSADTASLKRFLVGLSA